MLLKGDKWGSEPIGPIQTWHQHRLYNLCGSVKKKMQGSYLKIVGNFKMVTAEHETKFRAFFECGVLCDYTSCLPMKPGSYSYLVCNIDSTSK